MKTNNKNPKPNRNKNQKNEALNTPGKIKKRIRDVKRTLNSGKELPAQVITESKRRLRALEYELGEKTIDEQERTNASKYHKIKHFERKKAERKVKQAKKDLRENTDETKAPALQAKVDEAEIKLLYTTHFPKTLHYVSLYPTNNQNDETSDARRERVLKDIKESLLNGDKDLSLMQKRYRDEYKEKLIKRGVIQPLAPVDEEMTETKQGSDDEKDDFFEKA